MNVSVDRLTLAPAAILGGLAVALFGLARLVQLVGEAQDVEDDPTE